MIGAPAGAGVLRVASLPSDHVYVRHISDPSGDDGVVRLPEPFRGGPPGASWYPSPMLDPAWVERNAERFDLFHVHFGFDHAPIEHLRRFVARLSACGRPLAFTVHDLRNPHHADPAEHDRALDVLIGAASAVLTLTPGAAAEIARRWGVEPVVVPHPHVVNIDRLRRRRRARRDGVTIGIHLKSLRANMAALPSVNACLSALPEAGPGARLRVNLHRSVAESGRPAERALVAALNRLAAADPGLDLRIHPFFSDEELWDYMEAIDVSVLPYRFGTHSGWLEACHDLGAAVVAPDCGFYHEQRAVVRYRCDDSGPDARSLRRAVVRASREPAPVPPSLPARLAERRAIAALHRRVYASVIAGS